VVNGLGGSAGGHWRGRPFGGRASELGCSAPGWSRRSPAPEPARRSRATGTRPYGPWVGDLGEAARSIERHQLRAALGSGAPVLARLVPELDAALGGGAGTVAALSPEEERFRLYDAVARFLVAVAHQQPAVLVLDDLHWTDRDSCSCSPTAAASSARRRWGSSAPTATPLLDLTPDHPLVDTLAVLCREPTYARIGLAGLSHAEVGDFLTRVGQQGPPPALVQAIHRETGGNPFYVRQLWRHLVDEHMHPRRSASAWWHGPGPGG
jgi:AAA ATPase domain